MSVKPVIGALAMCCAANSIAACATNGTTIGTVKATVVGIEVRADCTYVLIKDVTTSLGALDTNPFLAGRYAYLGIDPAEPTYKAQMAVASLAIASNLKIYAEVVSNLGKVNRLSLSNEENNIP